jgi:hypothetical protein
VEARLTELIHPLTLGQVAHYHCLGLRERVLSLPVMVALVLSMIWRQVGSVATLTQLLHHEGLLWTAPVRVSQQALSVRLRAFPADLFRGVLDDLLPQMQARWQERRRPLPPELAWARERFKMLNAAGSRTRNKRADGPRPWSKDTVTALLTNPFYAGWVTHRGK